MTVGKIYCAKLMVENHRLNKKRLQFDILDDEEFRKQVTLSIPVEYIILFVIKGINDLVFRNLTR